jgi:hypothetical protein
MSNIPSEPRPDSGSSLSCPFTLRQIQEAFALLHEDRPLQVRAVLAGNINTIIQVAAGDRCYGLRVRTEESVYRYEADLVKEAFVLWLLTHAGGTSCDVAAAAAFSHLRAARCGTVTDRHAVLPVVCCYDWSRQRLPHPYCIYEWVDGVPLWDVPKPRVYALAGEVLARIHSVRFSAFYTDFSAVGAQPVSWQGRYRAAFDKEVSAARSRLSASVNAALRKLEIPPSVSYPPCLIHNDFAPGNILVRDGAIAAIIDWDNAVIDAPQLDFVKMKYWTAKSTHGELEHNPELFSAFVKGYGSTGQGIIESPIFRLYEILWLLRVFNFERSKEEQGLARAPGYPAAAVYEELLAEAIIRGE